MTAEEKTSMMYFLNLAGDYLKEGHSRQREKTVFEDDLDVQPEPEEKSGLPLAYVIEEPSASPDSGEAEETGDSLEDAVRDIAACRACGLAAARTRTVPGEGAIHPLVMVIGEGPGADEDAAGRPFVGKAGQLLDKMLESVSLYRNENCYIANVVKCRPPGNRDPQPDEIAACLPYLERQILLLRPGIILCAGRVAAQSLLKTSRGINTLRGEFAEFKAGEETIPVLPTFHPSAVLRDESLKRPAWEDLKLLRKKLDSFKDVTKDAADGASEES